MLLKKIIQDRRKILPPECDRRGDRELAYRFGAARNQKVLCLLSVSKNIAAALEVLRAFVG